LNRYQYKIRFSVAYCIGLYHPTLLLLGIKYYTQE
jgi:hypothetical protein